MRYDLHCRVIGQSNPESFRGSRRTEEREYEQNCCEYGISIFHKLNTDGEGHLFQRIEKIFRDPLSGGAYDGFEA